VTREAALGLLEQQGGWAADNAPFLLEYEGFSAGRNTHSSPRRELDEIRTPLPTVEQITGPPAPSSSGPETTPRTSSDSSVWQTEGDARVVHQSAQGSHRG
jgi:hypothetical protein